MWPSRSSGCATWALTRNWSPANRQKRAASDNLHHAHRCGKKGEAGGIRWTDNDPLTARLQCVSCLKLIEERFKTQMLAAGEWRATQKGDGGTIGFHLSSLYSPLGWRTWASCVDEFLKAKDNVELLKTKPRSGGC